MIDLIIRGGKVVDGTGNPAQLADVVINNGAVVSVASTSDLKGITEWDAAGKIVCPGFIDIHSHADFSLMADRRNESAIRQGITTLVTGNCGHGPAPATDPDLAKRNTAGFSESWNVDFSWGSFGEYLNALISPGLSTNVSPLVPHGSVRLSVMGQSTAEPTHNQLEQMKSLLDEAMQAGAIGFSTGLEYSPGMYADEDELVALASVAAKHGGIYASHIRNRGEMFESAVEEALNVCRKAGLPGQLSHFAPRPYARKGTFDLVLEMVEDAREKEGLTVGIDTFPDTWGPGMVVALLPPWVYEGDRKEVLKRLESPKTLEKCMNHFSDPTNYLLRLGGLEKFYLSSSIAHPELVGLNFIEIADVLDCEPVEGVFKVVLDDGDDFYNVMLRHIFATQTELDQLIQDPFCSIESDGVITAIDGPLSNFTMNRSSYGYTIRFIEEYVIGTSMFQLEEAIRKMTSLPATCAGLVNRGHLTEGAAADVVILDMHRLKDNTTDHHPQAYPSGVDAVIVNGQIVLDGDNRTEVRPGQLANSE